MSDLDSLGRSLWWLESRGPDLDALLVPRVPSSGENAGKAAVRGKSKPPLNLALVDLKIEAESVLGHWCGQVVSAFPGLGPVPVSRELGVRARWLGERLVSLESAPWLSMMADEVGSVATVVMDVVDPPESSPKESAPDVGSVDVIVSWLRHDGYAVSRSKVYRLIQSHDLPAHKGEDGRLIVRLDDVRACAVSAGRAG